VALTNYWGEEKEDKTEVKKGAWGILGLAETHWLKPIR